jgi:predicted unusual protein kinase regulating ubiquinone biosynthesis (AarF/ABC1/UbiB family)
LNRSARVRPPAAAFERLESLVAQMHARGVAHCDLRSPSNILVDDAGRPYLVDFVARVCRGAAWNLPWNWLFVQFCRADRNALAKLKVRFAPELASDEEQKRARHRGLLDRLARRLGAGVRAVTRLFVKGRAG